MLTNKRSQKQIDCKDKHSLSIGCLNLNFNALFPYVVFLDVSECYSTTSQSLKVIAEYYILILR